MAPVQKHTLNVPGFSNPDPSFRAVRSPYSGEVIAEVEQLSAGGMKQAMRVANQAFADRDGWLPPHKRIEILHGIATRIDARHEELSLLIAQEGGKPLVDARVEVTRAANTVRLAAEAAGSLSGEHVPMGATPASMGRLAFSVREPIGVVAAVSAFNHPLNLIAHQVAPAIASGCPFLVKPAGDTPLSCLAFVEMAHEAGLPVPWGMAVPCSIPVAEELVTSPQIAFFTFIGSAGVGWSLRSKVAPGTRCAMEHGGMAPIIVDEGFPVERAVPLLLKGGFYHAGQVCVSVQRIFAHDAVKDQLVQALTEGANALVVGDPTLTETQVGPLIRDKEVSRVASWVKEATEGGARIACGGKALEHQCYAPTVLVDPPADSKVMTEEVFGPVVCVSGFSNLDDAIRRSNHSQWAFQSAILTQNIDRALRAATRLDAGTVMINDHTAFRVDWMPFGGRKRSGLAVGGVEHTMKDMTQEKLIVLRSWDA